MNRDQQIENWLASLKIGAHSARPASSDASFRRYLRVDSDDGTRILMDAPPEHENCRPFVAVSKMLSDWGVHAPKIYARDLQQGFLLLEDLGSQTYLDAVSATPACASEIYDDAIDALVTMQVKAAADERRFKLPPYDEALLRQEMQLFPDWLLSQHLSVALNADQAHIWKTATDVLVNNALAQPQTFVHRDYHSRNLMVTDHQLPGVIDYQDAVNGPFTYDLVSLLRDCYVRWPDAQQARWIERFRHGIVAAGLDAGDAGAFEQQFDLMGIQRHLKASGIFARLHHRDGKPGYLGDIPQTLEYIVDVCEHHRQSTGLAVVAELGDLVRELALLPMRSSPDDVGVTAS